MTTVSIIGAGWLGKPLALHLQQQGYRVFASKTHPQGVEALLKSGLNGFICQLPESNQSDDYLALINILKQQECDVVVGCFPPGFRHGNGEEFAQRWKYLTHAAQEAKVNKIIMISSTTVYPTTDATVYESDATLALAQNNSNFSRSATTMLQAEQCVVDCGIEFVIIRCSGLIGPQRHPSRFVSKLKQVSTAAPANMLHLEDAVNCTVFTIQNVSNQIINATCPETVNKAEFYQAALNAAGSTETLPTRVDSPDKRISPQKIIDLGYSFHFYHTLDALKLSDH